MKINLKANIIIICLKLDEKFIKSRRHRDRFLTSHSVWLDEPMNDCNTTILFFRAAEKSSEITGVNKELIERFYIILKTLGSDYCYCTIFILKGIPLIHYPR